MNFDARRSDNGFNIQRIEYPECNTLFDELNSITNSQELDVITKFNALINMFEGYNVKGYLTLSTLHQFYPPSIKKLNKTKRFYDKVNIGCADKFSFFSLEHNYDCYVVIKLINGYRYYY